MKATKQKIIEKYKKTFLDPLFFPSVSSSIEIFQTTTYTFIFLG
jgi:hypothetical protein